MPLVSSPIPNLVGGITQQPASMRLPTMCQDMENAWPSVVSGLQKRPPTRHIADLGVAIAAGAAGHLIERDASYRYLVVVESGALKVIDLITGSQPTIHSPDGLSYLVPASGTCIDKFRFVTVGDTTFITNRDITVATAAVAETGGGPVPGQVRVDPTTHATVYVTQAAYNTYYSVYVNSVLKAQYLTPTGVSGSASCPDTGQIATALNSALVASGYTTIQDGSCVTITNFPAGGTLETQGGTGDKACRGFIRDVQSFSDLPPVMFEGRIVRVMGDPETRGDDYFVVYNKGVWIETMDWNAGEAFDQATMPHVLVREADGSWTFKKHVWEPRQVGDAVSSRLPSFVGTHINSLFSYTGRFGILADENVILSESANYENFFRTTTAQLLDSDPLDIAVLHDNVDILYHAVPYNRDLLLMSEKDQFRLTYANFLGQKTTQIQYSTSFNVSTRNKPFNVGNSVYFVDDRADYTFAKVFEFFPKDNATTDDADEVTAPIPEVIPSDVNFMAASNRSKTLVAHAVSVPNTLFVYRFYWSDAKKVQNAWSRWTFADSTDIRWAGFSSTYLYLLVTRNGTTHLERLLADEDVWDNDEDFEIMLDRRVTLAGGSIAYDSVTDKSTLTLPYSTVVAPEVVLKKISDGITGIRAAVTVLTSTTVRVDGDVRTYDVTAGIPYTMLFEFSRIFMKQRIPYIGGYQDIQDGRLQLRYLTLEYHDTSYFDVTVKHPGRDDAISKFSGAILGSGLNVLGRQPTANGKFRIPLMAKNYDVTIVLTNDTPFPCAFGSAEWQAIYSPKSATRIS